MGIEQNIHHKCKKGESILPHLELFHNLEFSPSKNRIVTYANGTQYTLSGNHYACVRANMNISISYRLDLNRASTCR